MFALQNFETVVSALFQIALTEAEVMFLEHLRFYMHSEGDTLFLRSLYRDMESHKFGLAFAPMVLADIKQCG